MAKAWLKEKINSIKKKTSIGNSRLSHRGWALNKRKTRKKYRGQGKS
jgi:hypothetical protein